MSFPLPFFTRAPTLHSDIQALSPEAVCLVRVGKGTNSTFVESTHDIVSNNKTVPIQLNRAFFLGVDPKIIAKESISFIDLFSGVSMSNPDELTNWYEGTTTW